MPVAVGVEEVELGPSLPQPNPLSAPPAVRVGLRGDRRPGERRRPAGDQFMRFGDYGAALRVDRDPPPAPPSGPRDR